MMAQRDAPAVLTPEAFNAEWQARQAENTPGVSLCRYKTSCPESRGTAYEQALAARRAAMQQPPPAPGILLVGNLIHSLIEAAGDIGDFDNGVEEIVISRRRKHRCVRR